MIVPRKDLIAVIEAFGSQQKFAEACAIDPTYLNRLLSRKRGVTMAAMEKICTFLKWSLDDAWEIIEGEDEFLES